MRRVARILKWFVMGLACLVLVIQFFGPARSNPSRPHSESMFAHVQVSQPVGAILDRSCNDCHSNKTRWPWYSRVAPVSWFVIDHVNHGRSHLNFSEWGRYNQREAGEMLSAICKEVKAGAMPLSSYTPMHPGSELTPEDVKLLCDWTTAERARLALAD
jgi:heme-binding protein